MKNVAEHKRVGDYTGHENRSAWKLLGYEPRYRGYYKRTGSPQEGKEDEHEAEAGNRTVTVAEVGDIP